MKKLLSDANETDGPAAHASGQLGATGYLLTADAIEACLDERREQITSLLQVRDEENAERVSQDLKRTILTLHVPQAVEDAAEEAFDDLKKPVMLRLLPVTPVANPLAPTIIIGIGDIKSALDAIRMLIAELFNPENLEQTTEPAACISIEEQPDVIETYRIIASGEHVVVEATEGFGAWVGFGEPDRFLVTHANLAKAEPGDTAGVFWHDGHIREAKRDPVSEANALEAATYFGKRASPPVLAARTADGLVAIGSLSSLRR